MPLRERMKPSELNGPLPTIAPREGALGRVNFHQGGRVGKVWKTGTVQKNTQRVSMQGHGCGPGDKLYRRQKPA